MHECVLLLSRLLSFCLPLSAREDPTTEDPPLDRIPAKGDGRPDLTDADELRGVDFPSSACDWEDEGSAILYHPPEYVRAMSWYSTCGCLGIDFPGDGEVGVGSGTLIHATVHFSSSTTSESFDPLVPAESARCDVCEGM